MLLFTNKNHTATLRSGKSASRARPAPFTVLSAILDAKVQKKMERNALCVKNLRKRRLFRKKCLSLRCNIDDKNLISALYPYQIQRKSFYVNNLGKYLILLKPYYIPTLFLHYPY